MPVAVVYSRDSSNVINLFDMPDQEKIGLSTAASMTLPWSCRRV